MTQFVDEGEPIRKITFYGITDKSFRWKVEVSEDDGKTWQERFRIDGKRIK